MTKYALTSTPQHIYNDFDRQGLLMQLPRLQNESNQTYKQRLMDVFVHRASSAHHGLINGITRELGLSIINCMSVVPVMDSDDVPLLIMPAVVFQDTKCYLYSDYRPETKTLLTTIDRWEIGDGAWDIFGLADKINATGYFTATILSDAESGKRSMTIFDQNSIKIIDNQDLSGSGIRIHLGNTNLIKGTIAIRSATLLRRVTSQIAIRSFGDYMIDMDNGIIYAYSPPSPGSNIRYWCRDDAFIAKASPVIIHNLQSDDFQTKMFEQITADDDTVGPGKATALGADIVNEILSLHPSNWGK